MPNNAFKARATIGYNRRRQGVCKRTSGCINNTVAHHLPYVNSLWIRPRRVDRQTHLRKRRHVVLIRPVFRKTEHVEKQIFFRFKGGNKSPKRRHEQRNTVNEQKDKSHRRQYSVATHLIYVFLFHFLILHVTPPRSDRNDPKLSVQSKR